MSLYKDCSVLPLKVFCEIQNTGKKEYLSYDNEYHDKEEFDQKWLDILIEYGKDDPSSSILDNIEKEQYVKSLIAEHTAINGALFYLMYQYDEELYNWLKGLGYEVKIRGGVLDHQSIEAQQKRSNHLITRVEIEKISFEVGNEKGKKSEMNFDDIMAMLSDTFKVQINDDITVKRFLAFKKRLLKKQNERVKEE